MADVVRGQLIVTVHESSGKNKDDEDVWDPTFTEGFVKGEILGASSFYRVVGDWLFSMSCLQSFARVFVVTCKVA